MVGILLLCFQKLLDLRGSFERTADHGGVSALDHTLLGHQKLGEVPLDAIRDESGRFELQVREQRMRVRAIDVHFGEQLELCGHLIRSKLFDLLVGKRLPATELIAGEGEDDESLW